MFQFFTFQHETPKYRYSYIIGINILSLKMFWGNVFKIPIFVDPKIVGRVLWSAKRISCEKVLLLEIFRQIRSICGIFSKKFDKFNEFDE